MVFAMVNSLKIEGGYLPGIRFLDNLGSHFFIEGIRLILILNTLFQTIRAVKIIIIISAHKNATIHNAGNIVPITKFIIKPSELL